MKQRIPSPSAWGQVAFEAEGNVTVVSGIDREMKKDRWLARKRSSEGDGFQQGLRSRKTGNARRQKHF
jgi:hypothetical protein